MSILYNEDLPYNSSLYFYNGDVVTTPGMGIEVLLHRQKHRLTDGEKTTERPPLTKPWIRL